MDIEPQPQERPVATETASVWSIAVQVAAYAGVAMGLVGTVALVATSVDPSDTTLLLVAIAVTAVLFAAGIAISGERISSNQRLRSVLWFAALLGWGIVVEAILVVAEIDPGGRVAPAAVRGLGRARSGGPVARPAQEPAVARRCTRCSRRPCSRSTIRSDGPISWRQRC